MRKAWLAGLLPGLAISAVFAADPAEVKAPYIEVGDCWTYRGKGLYNRGWVEEYELCVTLVDRARDVVLATATVKSDGREIDLSFTTEWGTGTAIGGLIATPPAKFLKFPLRIGDRYTVDFAYRSSATAHAQGTRSYEMEVVGWEDVVVPAGKFRAMKVVGRGFSRVPVGDYLQLGDVWWYVPEVGRFVKHVQETRIVTGSSEELIGYRLNK